MSCVVKIAAELKTEKGNVMKKVVKIVLVVILAVWAFVATGSFLVARDANNEKYDQLAELQAKYDKLKESSDALAKSWEEIQPGYQEYLEWKTQEALDVDTLFFESWAGLVSEKNFVCSVDGETVMVMVYAEGRTTKEMTTVLQEKVPTYCLMLKSSDFTNSILAVLGDNNEVLFGYTVSADGDAIAFLSEDYVN